MWRDTKRRQCNGSRRRQSTASVIETRFTEALRRISRVATREPISRSRARIQNSRGIIAPLEQPPKEIFSDRRGQAARLNQRGSFPRGRKSVRVEISIRHAGLVFNSGSGATPGWENASRGQVSRFSGAMTRSKTQRALKPLVTYVHARCGRY